MQSEVLELEPASRVLRRQEACHNSLRLRLMRETSKLIQILVAVAVFNCLVGCSSEAGGIKGLFAGCFNFSLIVSGIAMVIYFLLSWLFAVQERGEEERRQRERGLANAPDKLRKAVQEFQEWAPQCRSIVFEEAEKRELFQEGSASSRAREKSVAIIQRASRNAQLLYDDDITHHAYSAVEAAQGLRGACENCIERNRGAKRVTCTALRSSDRPAEMRFREAR